MAPAGISTPPTGTSSQSSSSVSSRSSSRPSLTLDLTSLPPLSQPSRPSNTLLITELHDLHLFQPASLDAIRSQITAVAPLNSFSPLPSLRRIVCSLHSTDDAVRVRQHLEAQNLLDRVRARIYFGEHTPIENTEEARRKKLLEAPQAQKLFFISPPPSPPHGWVMRNEEPPNKEVHASDLADALSRLGTDAPPVAALSNDPASPVSVSSDGVNNAQIARTGSWPVAGSAGRSRSSTILYHPSDHGGSPHLPAVMVEDTTVEEGPAYDSDMDLSSPVDASSQRKIFAHTSRPPVELME